MNTHYTLLGVDPQSDEEAITEAYHRLRERYNPEHLSEIDDDLRQVAVQRTAELERAYQILVDPQRRRQYDISINLRPADTAPARARARRQLTPRELGYAAVGVVAAIALVATIWLLTGRDAGVEGQAMGQVNRPAPPFTLETLDGTPFSLADQRGRVVLVNFWGTWCEPCKREMPALQAAHEQLGPQGLTVVGVNLTDDEISQGQTLDAIRAFVDQFGVTYPNVLDVEGTVTNDYRIFPLPTSFFIDGEGQIRYVHIGELTLNDVTARFQELRATARN